MTIFFLTTKIATEVSQEMFQQQMFLLYGVNSSTKRFACQTNATSTFVM